jgi:curved DNA-binding protein
MPVEFKDYYKILGVPREASSEDIKKAFRKLARKYHPDVAKDKKAAEERFKEINEAYEVLGDPGNRKKYDELGSQWKNGAGFQPPPGWGPGEAQGAPYSEGSSEFRFDGTGFSDFFEQFFGGRGRFGGFPGYGAQREYEDREDRRAGFARRGSDLESDILVTLEEASKGSVRVLTLQRTDRRTAQARTQTIKVKIPSGVIDGQIIRVPGMGNEGIGGGQPGDLYLRIRFAAHPDFRVRGADLYYSLDLAPWEAVLGTKIVVPTLQDRVSLKIPPGTNNGQQLRVRGHGLVKGQSGEKGDFFVLISIVVPEQVTEEERELWKSLGRVSHFNPRNS